MTALISAWDKNLSLAGFAHGLYENGVRIVASSGTKSYLEKFSNIKVTEISEFTGLKPVLNHRVVTLVPPIHGGLLAEQHQLKELAELGWPKIDLVAVTFYPLAQKMAELASAEAINEAVDIGGPAMVRSACKGGRIVVTDEQDFVWVINGIKKKKLTDRSIKWLQAVAAARVMQYQASESLFRTRQLKPR